MNGIIRRDFLKIIGTYSPAFLTPNFLFKKTDKINKPNIILIMADDLGYECIGCYGGQSYKTPVLDQLTKTGVRFQHCYSQPLCTPSRVQIMTGRYNFRNYKMFGYLDLPEITFGHVLKETGYNTCIAGKWQLGNGIEGPYHAGFNEYCLWQIYSNIAGKGVAGSRYADPKIYQNGKVLKNTKGKYGPDIFCNYILDFIERNKSKPFFIYYPMALIHGPFVPTPDSQDWMKHNYKNDKKYFSDMVTYMDKIIGRIVNKLEELDVREKTLILFTGDNGTDRRIQSRINGDLLQGGKSLMTDAGTHVPLIASWQGMIPENSVCYDLIDFTDFMPTLEAIANTALPEKVKIDGRSFPPQLYGKKGNPREWVFTHYWGYGRDIMKTRRCVRNKQWKLYDDGSFFNVSSDPLEQNPIRSEEITGKIDSVRNRFQSVLDKMK